MSDHLNYHEALIYVMVTMSAVDRNMTDEELARIGTVVRDLPVFHGFDPEGLVMVAQACGEQLSTDDGLSRVLNMVGAGLPGKLRETAYAVAVEVAAADLDIKQEELRFLSLLRDQLGLDKLTTAAIERGARARYQMA
ncbi:MAG: tellurite resistance TerB family protein [Hyphomicrobiaceae bacterium]